MYLVDRNRENVQACENSYLAYIYMTGWRTRSEWILILEWETGQNEENAFLF